jgi:hypothetical protein
MGILGCHPPVLWVGTPINAAQRGGEGAPVPTCAKEGWADSDVSVPHTADTGLELRGDSHYT